MLALMVMLINDPFIFVGETICCTADVPRGTDSLLNSSPKQLNLIIPSNVGG